LLRTLFLVAHRGFYDPHTQEPLYPKFGSWVIAVTGRIGGLCGNGNARTGNHHSPGG
jgi:hypothetical protein